MARLEIRHVTQKWFISYWEIISARRLSNLKLTHMTWLISNSEMTYFYASWRRNIYDLCVYVCVRHVEGMDHVVSHICMSCHVVSHICINMSCRTYASTSCRVAHMHQQYHTHASFMLHNYLGHVAHMNVSSARYESTYEWVMTCMNESQHISHDTRTKEKCCVIQDGKQSYVKTPMLFAWMDAVCTCAVLLILVFVCLHVPHIHTHTHKHMCVCMCECLFVDLFIGVFACLACVHCIHLSSALHPSI